MVIKVLLCLVAALFISSAFADVHKWKDAAGKTHYGDAPVAGGTDKVRADKQPVGQDKEADKQDNVAYKCTTFSGSVLYKRTPCPKRAYDNVSVTGGCAWCNGKCQWPSSARRSRSRPGLPENERKNACVETPHD